MPKSDMPKSDMPKSDMPGGDRRYRQAVKGVGIAGAVAGALLGGIVAGALLYAGSTRVRETTPLGSLRASIDPGEGRDAAAPHEIPLGGWIAVIRRTAFLIVENRLMTQSAAVTFYTLLALFPALTATVSIYGLVSDPAAIQRLVDLLDGIVPSAALGLLHGQLGELIANGPKGLTVGVALGLAAALWSANQGSKALFDALNVIYREDEKRSYPLFVLIAMAFTLGAIVFVMAAMVAVVAFPVVLSAFHLGRFNEALVAILRWPAILVFVGLFLASLYRFGPSRENPKWRWVTWGGCLAALSWVAVSFAFSAYVQRFGSFDRTYGSLGTIVGFLTWIWLSTLVALCGAQLNSEMEHQTAIDTTSGPALPLGWRGATQADTVA